MNPFALHISSVITICLATQLLVSLASSSVQRVQRKVPDNALQLKETTTLEPENDDIDDVFAIPIDDFRGHDIDINLRIGPFSSDQCWLYGQDSIGILVFTKFKCRDYWYGRRLKKRSLLSFDEDIDMDKKSQYQPWGGKRAWYPDIFQVPKGFNPNGGKRSDTMLSGNAVQPENGRKRTAKTFQNWAGKRNNNGKSFVIWGGKKRADSFRTWGGKRADSFKNWGGKRADSFRTWGGKR